MYIIFFLFADRKVKNRGGKILNLYLGIERERVGGGGQRERGVKVG